MEQQEAKEAQIHEDVRRAGTPYNMPKFTAKDLTPAMRDMMATGNITPAQFGEFRKLFNGVTGMRAQGNQQEYEAQLQERKQIAVDLIHAKEVKTTETRDRHLQAARAGHEVVERVITQLPDGTTTTQERVEKRNQEAVDEKEHVEIKTESREVFIARVRQCEERIINMHIRLHTLEKGAMTRRTEEAKDAIKLKEMYRWVGFAIWFFQNEMNRDPMLTPGEMKAKDVMFQNTMDLVTIPLYLKYALGQDVEIPQLLQVTEHCCGERPPQMDGEFFGVSKATVNRCKTPEEQQYVRQNFFQPNPIKQHWIKATFCWQDGYELEDVWVPELLMRSHVPYLSKIDDLMEDHLDAITHENIQSCKREAELQINPTITPETLLPQVNAMTDAEKREADIDPQIFKEDPVKAISEPRKPQPSNLQGGLYEEMAQNMKRMQKEGKSINLFSAPPERSTTSQPTTSSSSSSSLSSSYMGPLQRYHGLLEHMFDNITENKIAEQYQDDMKVLQSNAQSLVSPNAKYADNTDTQVLYETLGYDPVVIYRHYLRGIQYPEYKYMPTVLKAEQVAFFSKTPGMFRDMGQSIWKDDQPRPWVKCIFSTGILPKYQEGVWLPVIVFLWCKTLCKCRLYNCECRWRCIEPAWDAIDKAVCSHRDAKTRRSYDVELDP